MPYEPEKNAGIDKDFSRSPNQKKFRVVGVDTFDGDDWIEGEFDTLQEARKHVAMKTAGKQMLVMHIYDENGRHVGAAGTF